LTSPPFATGAANLQFWAYGNGGAGSTIAVSKAWSAAGPWSTPWHRHEWRHLQRGAGPQTTQLKFSFTKNVNCAFDDVVVQGTAGPAEDPNLVAPAALAFGTVAPGAAATQTLPSPIPAPP
jgi:hypothetical protein